MCVGVWMFFFVFFLQTYAGEVMRSCDMNDKNKKKNNFNILGEKIVNLTFFNINGIKY